MFGFTVLDLAVIVVYIIITTWIGLWASRKAKDMRGFFMGNRAFGKVFTAMHVFGTITHTDQAVPTVSRSYDKGLAGIWYQWIWLLTTPFSWLWVHLLRRMRYVTFADFFAERYGPLMGIYYAFWGIAFMVVVMGTMLYAQARTFEGLTNGGLSFETSVIGTAILFMAYGVSGGIVAAVVTDFFQGILTIVFSFLLIPFALYQVGGFEGLHQKLDPSKFNLVASDEITLFFIVMCTLAAFFNAPQPHHMQMGGVSKKEIDVRVGNAVGGLIKRLCTVAWMLIGVCAAAILPGIGGELNDAKAQDAAFGKICLHLLGPVGFGLLGLMAASMLAAVMSSCDAFMVDASALFTKNIYKRYLKKDASDSDCTRMARHSSVLLVIASIIMAFSLGDVIAGIMTQMDMTIPLGILFWAAIVWRRANRYGAWVSLIATMGVWLAVRYNEKVGLGFIHEAKLDTYAWQICWMFVTGIPTLIIVSLFTKREPKETLDKFYTVMHTPVGQEHKLREAGIKVEME